MPKVIVLLCDAGSSVEELGAVVAEGAKGVRFAEVDVRTVGRLRTTGNEPYKSLGSADRIREYDGIIMVCTIGDVPAALGGVFDHLEQALPTGEMLNKVLAATGAGNQRVVERLARLGGIIVCEPYGTADSLHAGRALGARVAKVAEWVRHALSHEQANQHHH